MKKKILSGFGLLLCIFLGGSIIAVIHITRMAHRMEKLITLHRVEILREDLIIRVQQVQSHIYSHRTRSGRDVDVLIGQVQEMNRVMDACLGCHHAPELTQGLLGMRDTANDYQTAISRLITASGNPAQYSALERRAQDIGQELIAMTQGMAFMANIGLQQKTQETMATIREVRNVLCITLLLGFFLALATGHLLIKSLGQGLRKLLEATRRISHGDFQHRVEVSGAQGSEFNELGEAFNAMTQNLQFSQRQLVQSAKFAAIGELATNIAYEVNNPLTGVLGYTGLLLKADDVPADKKEYLKTIERETLRAREVLKNLLDFSRRKPPRLAETNVAALIHDTIPLVKSQARLGNVRIAIDCQSELPLVAIDADEMKQVFVNLINNACFAMPKGGALTIRCGHDKDLSGKEVVTVAFIDTGQGIPEEHLDRIFDPFFTTRPEGEGTGLGLSVSYMIVQNHGGRIEVASSLGSGSTFTVVLPV
ncbi:MAG TPA: ATP-binding protein [Nitrospirota bacterium]